MALSHPIKTAWGLPPIATPPSKKNDNSPKFNYLIGELIAVWYPTPPLS